MMARVSASAYWRALVWVVWWMKQPLDRLERWLILRWAHAESETLRCRAERARNGG